jgi:glutamate--cysteine ligase
MTKTSAATAATTKQILAEGIRKNRKRISEWAMEHSRLAPPPFYSSIDIRDSGVKVVPVDSNLYPAGFNNVCPEDQRTAPPIFRAQVEAAASRAGLKGVSKLLILPESHTSNSFYFENLFYLSQIVANAGFEVKIGWHGPLPKSADGVETTLPLRFKSESGKPIEALPILIRDGVLSADGGPGTEPFVPDLILLNNDFSSGYPKELDDVKQPILPSHRMGWHSRKKSDHFRHYNRLAAEFAEIVGLDPWLIQIDTEEVSPVNFNEEEGIDRVADSVDRIVTRTRAAYASHGIASEPFVFVKNNAGTYGMGITVVHSADEVRSMNRRTKNKMSVGKNRSEIVSVAVQEGIPTATLVDRLAAEPVIYLFGGELIGGFLRTNTERGAEDNLNSAGMVFRKLCMADLRDFAGDEETAADASSDPSHKEEPVMELVYGAIARISALAAGKEIAEKSGRV